ncbi:hypothetical protein niasHT_003175 [Heterodera trifolii]|uniref:DUF7083 domain-containing protein n=1 Tax=Heterodera trifolii TaxID=157864 RepID=A0ABD2MBB5_9BILA
MDAKQMQDFLDAMKALASSVQQQQQNVQANSSNSATLASSINARLDKFNYDPESGHTFESWLKRYGQIIIEDGKDLPDKSKVQLLIGKLGEQEYKHYTDSVAPKTPSDFDWSNTTAKLKQIFGETRSLFLRRFDCFQIRQSAHQDISALIAQINSSCENADLALAKDELKCMILIIALRDEFSDLRQKCLQRMEDARSYNKTVTLHELGEECKKYQILKESALSLNSNQFNTNAIRAWKNLHLNSSKISTQSQKRRLRSIMATNRNCRHAHAHHAAGKIIGERTVGSKMATATTVGVLVIFQRHVKAGQQYEVTSWPPIPTTMHKFKRSAFTHNAWPSMVSATNGGELLLKSTASNTNSIWTVEPKSRSFQHTHEKNWASHYSAILPSSNMICWEFHGLKHSKSFQRKLCSQTN